MFKLEVDSEWIKKTQDTVISEVSERLEGHFDHIARGVISDAIRSALKSELAKPEYTARVETLVREMLMDTQVKDVLKHLINRY